MLKITDAGRAMEWIRGFAEHSTDGITSAWKEAEAARAYKKNNEQRLPTFRMLALTKAGYVQLGIPEDQHPDDRAFKEGMENAGTGLRTKDYEKEDNPNHLTDSDDIEKNFPGISYEKPVPDLSDPPKIEWDKPYVGSIHAMIVVADETRESLDGALTTTLNSIEASGGFEVLEPIEPGNVITRDGEGRVETGRRPQRDAGTYAIEHFGYADGIAQPRFTVQDVEKQRMHDGLGPDDKWMSSMDPSAPPSLILVQDYPNTSSSLSYGSYLVFRKLEQDVEVFEAGVRNLQQSLDSNNSHRGPATEADSGNAAVMDRAREAGALALGRYPEGSPLFDATGARVQSAAASQPTARNNFDYKGDPDGQVCPFHAHVRRVNSRGELGRIGPELSTAEQKGARWRRKIGPLGVGGLSP
jgi:deferrochelatase/peroxidase EfeB